MGVQRGLGGQAAVEVRSKQLQQTTKKKYWLQQEKIKKHAQSELNANDAMCIWVMWADWFLADWVIAGQTGPSRTKEMHAVSFQGFSEVSRQMGMEMSRQRAHFNLARTADPVITLSCLHANTTRILAIPKDAHTAQAQINTQKPDREKGIFHSLSDNS